MSNWLAEVGSDPSGRIREIAHEHTAFLAGQQSWSRGPAVRDVVAQSWLRSAAAAVDPDVDPPVNLLDGEFTDYRGSHPLSNVIAMLRDIVGGVAEDGKHIMAVSDAAGRLLWVEGERGARAQAARMNFVEGALWDESHAGTNAPGTALALGHEVQIFAAEHFRHIAQTFTCAAAPIHDPITGETLGVIDVTGGNVVAHPHSLALVRAAARAAEAELLTIHPPAKRLWLPRSAMGRTAARLEVLGRGDGLVHQNGGVIRVNRRHAEILFILASHPDGMTGDQLATALYDDHGSETTVRVEVTRLRRMVGKLVQSRPYRINGVLETDVSGVTAALRRGDVPAAVEAYVGPLLPSSEAPAVIAQRTWLEAQLRSAVLATGAFDQVYAWAERFGFDDLEAWERLVALAPEGTRRAVAAARVRQLHAEYGFGGHATFR